MFIFFGILGLALVNMTGQADNVVNNVNHAFGTHMTGLGVWSVFYAFCLILEVVTMKRK